MTQPQKPEVQEPTIVFLTPPARLRKVLMQFTDRGDYDDTATGTVLAHMVQENPAETKENWYKAHLTIMAMIRNAAEFTATHVLDYDGSPHDDTYKQLHSVVGTTGLNEQWRGCRNSIVDLVRTSLRFSVHDTDSLYREIPAVTVSEVEKIKTQTTTLIETVKQSGLPAQVKKELLKALYVVQDRLVRFDLFGLEGLRDATAQFVGIATIHGTAIEKEPVTLKETLELYASIGKLMELAFKVGEVAGRAWLALKAGGVI